MNKLLLTIEETTLCYEWLSIRSLLTMVFLNLTSFIQGNHTIYKYRVNI